MFNNISVESILSGSMNTDIEKCINQNQDITLIITLPEDEIIKLIGTQTYNEAAERLSECTSNFEKRYIEDKSNLS